MTAFSLPAPSFSVPWPYMMCYTIYKCCTNLTREYIVVYLHGIEDVGQINEAPLQDADRYGAIAFVIGTSNVAQVAMQGMSCDVLMLTALGAIGV